MSGTPPEDARRRRSASPGAAEERPATPGGASRGATRAQGSAPPRRPDASMSLLTDVMYRPVPTPPPAADRPPSSPAATAVRAGASFLLALALGAFTVSAIATLRTPGDAVQESRLLLEREITERSEEAGSLQERVAALSEEIAVLQEEALATADPGLVARLAEDELLSGAVPVTGPGLVLEVDDADVPAPSQVDPRARVQDTDLQVITNGLWAAGAEAIAINGHRLTALSAIRGAGQAILVDLAPVLAPYRIEAVGDPQAMQTAFVRSTAAGRLATLQSAYDIRWDLRAAPELTLPGSGGTTLRYAEGIGPDVASSATAEGEETR